MNEKDHNKDEKNLIDELLAWVSKNPKDTWVILIFAVLILFGIYWKSSSILIFSFILIIIFMYAGYQLTRKAASQILQKWLQQHGVDTTTSKTITNLIHPISVSESEEHMEGVPAETSQEINIKKLDEDSILNSKMARKAISDGDYEKAIKLLELAIEIDNRNWLAYERLGTIYLNYKKDVDLALKYLKQATELDKKHFNQFMNIGVAYIWKKKAEKAIEHLNLAIKIIEDDKIARHLPRFVMEYGKCLLFIGESYKMNSDITMSLKYIKLSIKKFNEVPNQYKDTVIKHWLIEAKARAKELQNTKHK